MTSPELSRELAKRKQESARIWKRVSDILEEFGTRHGSLRDCCSTLHVEFHETVANHKVDIVGDSHGQFHENFEIEVKIDMRLVFKADKTDFPESRDPRCLVKVLRESDLDGYDYYDHVEILHYSCDVSWSSVLNLNNIRKALKLKNRPLEFSKTEKPNHKVISDTELMNRFGIKTT